METNQTTQTTTIEGQKPTEPARFSYFKDGCFFIDGSGLSVIQECPTKAYNILIRRRRAAGESPALRLGHHIHEALAYRNKAIASKQPWSEEEQIKLLEELFTSTPCESEDWRNLDFAKQVIQHYNEQFGLESPEIFINPANGQPVVEHSLAVDTGEVVQGWRIIYIGRIDYLSVEKDGLFINDYKTTSVLGELFWKQFEVDEAQRGYCWAIKKTLGIEPCGYVIRALAFRKPTKTGTSIEFENQRFFTAQPTGQLDRWYNNMMNQVEVFLWHHNRSVFPFYHKSCITRYNQACEFFDVCNVNPHSGSVEAAREALLMGGGFKDNDWSPLVG